MTAEEFPLKTLTIRGLNEQLSKKLKIEAKKNNKSVNQYTIIGANLAFLARFVTIICIFRCDMR